MLEAALKKDREGQEDAYAEIEKSLKGGLANLAKLCKTTAGAIGEAETRKDLPDAAKRDKQITVLEALHANSKLRTEPAKLTRLCDDLAADSEAFNAIETKIESLIDEDFARQWAAAQSRLMRTPRSRPVLPRCRRTDGKTTTPKSPR